MKQVCFPLYWVYVLGLVLFSFFLVSILAKESDQLRLVGTDSYTRVRLEFTEDQWNFKTFSFSILFVVYGFFGMLYNSKTMNRNI